MADLPVHLVSVQHIPLVGNDLKITNWTRVTILVGSFGPFTKDFPAGGDSAEAINAWKVQQQHAVQAING